MIIYISPLIQTQDIRRLPNPSQRGQGLWDHLKKEILGDLEGKEGPTEWRTRVTLQAMGMCEEIDPGMRRNAQDQRDETQQGWVMASPFPSLSSLASSLLSSGAPEHKLLGPHFQFSGIQWSYTFFSFSKSYCFPFHPINDWFLNQNFFPVCSSSVWKSGQYSELLPFSCHSSKHT